MNRQEGELTGMQGRLAGYKEPTTEGLLFRDWAQDESTIRTIVDEQLEKRLHPGLPDPRYYIHAEVRDPQTGHTYRGMLYLVEPIAEVNDGE